MGLVDSATPRRDSPATIISETTPQQQDEESTFHTKANATTTSTVVRPRPMTAPTSADGTAGRQIVPNLTTAKFSSAVFSLCDEVQEIELRSVDAVKMTNRRRASWHSSWLQDRLTKQVDFLDLSQVKPATANPKHGDQRRQRRVSFPALRVPLITVRAPSPDVSHFRHDVVLDAYDGHAQQHEQSMTGAIMTRCDTEHSHSSNSTDPSASASASASGFLSVSGTAPSSRRMTLASSSGGGTYAISRSQSPAALSEQSIVHNAEEQSLVATRQRKRARASVECLICFETISCGSNGTSDDDDNDDIDDDDADDDADDDDDEDSHTHKIGSDSKEQQQPYWSCHSGCVVCNDCLTSYLQHKISDKGFYNMQCPGYCQEVLTFEAFANASVDADIIEEVKVGLALATNPDLIKCPQCNELTDSRRNRPNLQCAHCDTSFCYFHGLNHRGRECAPRNTNPFQRIGNQIWLWRHTRKCNQCKHRIQKNGGCNHMTCRCRHEMCWCCGGDYRVNGRNAHGKRLFPKPSELKYQCNSPKMWAARTGIVTLGPAVAASAAGLAVGVGALALIGYVPYKVIGNYKRKRAVRRRQRELARRRAAITAGDEVDRQLCRAKLPEGEVCLLCSGAFTCTHAEQTGSRCGVCNHYIARNNCEHYYARSNPTACMFCNALRDDEATPLATYAAMDIELSSVSEAASLASSTDWSSDTTETYSSDSETDNEFDDEEDDEVDEEQQQQQQQKDQADVAENGNVTECTQETKQKIKAEKEEEGKVPMTAATSSSVSLSSALSSSSSSSVLAASAREVIARRIRVSKALNEARCARKKRHREFRTRARAAASSASAAAAASTSTEGHQANQRCHPSTKEREAWRARRAQTILALQKFREQHQELEVRRERRDSDNAQFENNGHVHDEGCKSCRTWKAKRRIEFEQYLRQRRELREQQQQQQRKAEEDEGNDESDDRHKEGNVTSKAGTVGESTVTCDDGVSDAHVMLVDRMSSSLVAAVVTSAKLRMSGLTPQDQTSIV